MSRVIWYLVAIAVFVGGCCELIYVLYVLYLPFAAAAAEPASATITGLAQALFGWVGSPAAADGLLLLVIALPVGAGGAAAPHIPRWMPAWPAALAWSAAALSAQVVVWSAVRADAAVACAIAVAVLSALCGCWFEMAVIEHLWQWLTRSTQPIGRALKVVGAVASLAALAGPTVFVFELVPTPSAWQPLIADVLLIGGLGALLFVSLRRTRAISAA